MKRGGPRKDRVIFIRNRVELEYETYMSRELSLTGIFPVLFVLRR